MSNRRRPQRRTCLDDLADVVGDQRIHGGCDDCAAYQTMSKQSDGIFSVTVHHDACCPWLAARETTYPKGERQ